MMLSAGEPLAWVSKQMGHRDVVFTARTYAQWIPNASPELGLKAVEMFGDGQL
jgi:integrase